MVIFLVEREEKVEGRVINSSSRSTVLVRTSVVLSEY